MAGTSAPAYLQLLEEALELGRVDGRFAAAFEPATAPRGDRCLGRTPEEFARLLWEDRPGTPPAGLELSAPHWYATGFGEGMAAAGVGRTRAGGALLHRQVFS
ncbi:hypothetical protein [Blastococcus haudaquaticus]|uniref:Uncharacterized protein n=1 Tax=Blastococcus haudaquaticus TaxID=1938745 RepID=A0A286H132_9ACTN|nr:hypothetical protein [Blastococcus haudaquaticus]SOE01477.1 hypothetical protein SAMN06272739_3187 [Blastococcus haudaquaticus]